jgi:hypothetical protein
MLKAMNFEPGNSLNSLPKMVSGLIYQEDIQYGLILGRDYDLWL